jgi:hypothetical protein
MAGDLKMVLRGRAGRQLGNLGYPVDLNEGDLAAVGKLSPQIQAHAMDS